MVTSKLKTFDKDLIVYKKVLVATAVDHSTGRVNYDRQVLARLKIPAGTLVLHCEGYKRDSRKCRAEMAIVTGFYSINKPIKTGRIKELKVAVSMHDNSFQYILDKSVRPIMPFEKSTNCCSSGIHFFFKSKDAKEY